MKTLVLTSKGIDLEFVLVENKRGERFEAYLNSYSSPFFTGLQNHFFYFCGEGDFDSLEEFVKEQFDQRYESFCYRGLKQDAAYDALIDAIYEHQNESIILFLRREVIEHTLNDERCIADRDTVSKCLDIVIQYFKESAEDDSMIEAMGYDLELAKANASANQN